MDFAEVQLKPLFRGDPRTIVFNITDPDGVPVNLVESTWDCTIREFTTATFGQALDVDVSQAGDGVLSVNITAEQSAILKRRFVGDLQGNNLFGTIVRFRADVLSSPTPGEPAEGLIDVVNLVWGGLSQTAVTSTVRAVLLGEPAQEVFEEHVADQTPHPAYDDIPSLVLTFENGLA